MPNPSATSNMSTPTNITPPDDPLEISLMPRIRPLQKYSNLAYLGYLVRANLFILTYQDPVFPMPRKFRTLMRN